MGAFLENPMFFFVDDAEPVLPIFQSNNYDRVNRIVELADVGCDTETSFSSYFPRGASDRHRAGVENFESTHRTAKRLNNKPNEFRNLGNRRFIDINNNEVSKRDRRLTNQLLRYPLDSSQDRNKNYERKAWQNNYDDVYVATRDYDGRNYDSESPYHNFNLPRNVSEVERYDDYYDRFVDPRNSVPHPYRERIPRYDYSPDFESSFMQSIHVPRRESAAPRWLVESDEQNIREMYDPNLYLNERKKQTKAFIITNSSFNRETEFRKSSETMTRRERDYFPNAAGSVAKNTFWNFIPCEDNVKCNEATFCELMKSNDRGELQTMMPNGKRSYILDSQLKRIDTVDSEEEKEEEIKETILKDFGDNLSVETPINNARNRTLKNDAIKEKCKNLRLNSSNASSSREQLIKTPVDERFSNMPAEKMKVPFVEKEKEKEKERKFLSKLPIRTWKRLRTKKPAALNLRNDATNVDVNREFGEIKKESTNDCSRGAKNDDVRVKDRAAANRNDVKSNKRFEAELLSAGKPGSNSFNLKSTKEIKGSGTEDTLAQRKKKVK